MRCGLTARNIRGGEGAERGVTNWQKEDRMFVSEGGMGAPHWQREAKLNSGGIRSGGPKNEEVTVLNVGTPRRSRDAARKTTPRVKAA